MCRAKVELQLVFILFFTYGLCAVKIQTPGDKKHHPASSSGRAVITVVKFPNVPCTSATRQLSGICFSFHECIRLRGTQIGTCASGYGVCCIFHRTCSSTTNQNLTHFTNPGFPEEFSDSAERICSLILLRPKRIPLCQVRLDFLDFELLRPVDGDCLDDSFSVTGQNVNSRIPEICGLNTGHHVYVDVENTDGPIMLKITTKGRGRRKWNVKATLIECSNPSKAPRNCLQYYTGASGRISSFNYIPTENSAESGGYLNGLNYAICFRKEEGRCSQTYSVPSGKIFTLLNVNDDNSPTVGGGEAGLGISECPRDYIRLDGDRYCGARLSSAPDEENPTFNGPVTDNSSGPFIAQFVTDGSVNSVGFELDFVQNKCESNSG